MRRGLFVRARLACFWQLLLLAAISAALLAGCSAGPEPSQAAGVPYRVYYIAPSETELKYDTIYLQEKETEPVLAALTNSLTGGSFGAGIYAVPPSMSLEKYAISNQILYLYWQGDYDQLSPARKVLFQAAVAKTYTQISGISYIHLTVGDVSLRDSAGRTIGLLNASSFTDNIAGNAGEYKSVLLPLYYADETGTALVETELEVSYKASDVLERILIRQLLGGPENSSAYAAVNSSATLLGISVRDGICTVNFDDLFLVPPQNVSPFVTIYSVVNSLTMLPNISKVQIMINSSTEYSFGGLSLSVPLEFNSELIGG